MRGQAEGRRGCLQGPRQEGGDWKCRRNGFHSLSSSDSIPFEVPSSFLISVSPLLNSRQTCPGFDELQKVLQPFTRPLAGLPAGALQGRDSGTAGVTPHHPSFPK